MFEIFRSPRLSECNERAFMLYAVGIASAIARDGREYLLLVDVDDTPAAGEPLHLYEQEGLVTAPPPPPSPKLHPHALKGSISYALVLFFVAFAVANGLWRLDSFNVGELNAGLVQQGQWWGVCTALTLHNDTLRLVSNTVFGMWFGYLASRLIGVGNAWLLVVLGAGFANWVEGYFGPPGHLSVGASTALFRALGLLSGFSWRTRLAYPQRWALRWAPLVAGIVLLSWTGTGGESIDQPGSVGTGLTVDVLAHALGFVVGLGAGAVAALKAAGRVLDRVPQWLAGLLALLPLALAWVRALSS